MAYTPVDLIEVIYNETALAPTLSASISKRRSPVSEACRGRQKL